MNEPIPLTIVRDAIPTNSISNVLMVRPGVGYIRIKDFTYTTVRELDDAIAKLEQQGMKKLVLDLRMNPGGSARRGGRRRPITSSTRGR